MYVPLRWFTSSARVVCIFRFGGLHLPRKTFPWCSSTYKRLHCYKIEAAICFRDDWLNPKDCNCIKWRQTLEMFNIRWFIVRMLNDTFGGRVEFEAHVQENCVSDPPSTSTKIQTLTQPVTPICDSNFSATMYVYLVCHWHDKPTNYFDLSFACSSDVGV